MIEMIRRLSADKNLSDADLKIMIEDGTCDEELLRMADGVRREHFGRQVYIRGLIELSNYCRNDCYYCGIRRSNQKVVRYRLSKEEILDCCCEGYSLGFRTFVLQSGEDMHYSDDIICDIVSEIKSKYADCAVTLSLGERSTHSYQLYFEAGADRYLLRHETADEAHYSRLHPEGMDLMKRQECLRSLKAIGYQVGSGFMVGSPYQTTDCIIQDLRFLQELKPAMIGIGPYLSHSDTPFREFENGSLTLTLRLIAILRLMFPNALIPSTTALGTVAPNGRELGLQAGANVVMPNLSPKAVRKKYALYDGKICTGEEAAECRVCLERRINSIGYEIAVSRGDAPGMVSEPTT